MDPVTGATWGALSDDDLVDHADVLGTGENGDGDYDWSAFNQIKAANFRAARRPIFHYVGLRAPGVPWRLRGQIA